MEISTASKKYPWFGELSFPQESKGIFSVEKSFLSTEKIPQEIPHAF
jgi:hypothetical protein